MENELITAIGAICEACGFFMRQLLAQGFTRKEAIQIIQTYVEITLTGGQTINE